MAYTDLEGAIAEAAEEILKDTPQTDATTTETDTSTDTNDSDVSTGETSDETDKLSEKEIKEAETLYKLLKDPRQRLNIVAALAQDSGLLAPQTPLNTEKQVAKAEKGIAQIIDEALPEYPGLSKKLGPAIEQIVEAERESRAAEMEQVHLKSVEDEVASELALLAHETKGESRKLENKMSSLMNNISPGPNVTVKQYVRMLYTLATAGSQAQKTSAEIADKIRRNANNAPDRLKGAPGTADRSVPSKKMSLNESINWAIEQASKGRTRA